MDGQHGQYLVYRVEKLFRNNDEKFHQCELFYLNWFEVNKIMMIQTTQKWTFFTHASEVCEEKKDVVNAHKSTIILENMVICSSFISEWGFFVS